MSPPDMVSLKRALDERAHISAPLFDRDFLGVYNEFVEDCFKTFNAWGEDPKLRTLTDRRKQALGSVWQAEWDSCFADRTEALPPSDLRRAYTSLMSYLAVSMGATQVDAHILGSGRLPANYDTDLVRVLSRTPPDPEVT